MRLYIITKRGHLQTITANTCYKSSVYTINKHTEMLVILIGGTYITCHLQVLPPAIAASLQKKRV